MSNSDVTAGSQLSIIRRGCYHFEGPHHLVVFVFEDVAVPDLAAGRDFGGVRILSHISKSRCGAPGSGIACAGTMNAINFVWI